MKKFIGGLTFLLGFDCRTRRKAVEDGICSFDGQGRDKFGK